MSFSNDVRREICSAVSDNDKRFVCLYGMLLFSRTLSPEHICFQTESNISAEFFGSLFRNVFRYNPECHENSRKDGTILYSYDINDKKIIDEIYQTYKFINVRTINSEIIVTNSIGGFTAGIFLACGSVNDPSKEYHLEFSVPGEVLSEELIVLLGDIGVNAKTTIRRGQYIVYIKETKGNDETVDAKFLTCVYKEDAGVDKEEKTITETVKLPVTFDSGAILFTVLGIIIIALAIFVFIRIKSNKKDENK